MTIRIRALFLAIVVAGLAASFVPSADARGMPPADGVPRRYGVFDGRNDVSGYMGWNSTTPTKLLIYAHPCCRATNDALDTQSAVYVRTTLALVPDLLVVAPDYRGDGNWNVRTGVEDVVHAAVNLTRSFPSITNVVVHGVSMGSLVAATAAAENPEVFDGVAVGMGFGDYPGLIATTPWRSIARLALLDMGGADPSVDPAPWARYSPIHRAADLARVDRIAIAQDLWDLMIPYTEGQRLCASLVEAGARPDCRTSWNGRYKHSSVGIGNQFLDQVRAMLG